MNPIHLSSRKEVSQLSPFYPQPPSDNEVPDEQLPLPKVLPYHFGPEMNRLYSEIFDRCVTNIYPNRNIYIDLEGQIKSLQAMRKVLDKNSYDPSERKVPLRYSWRPKDDDPQQKSEFRHDEVVITLPLLAKDWGRDPTPPPPYVPHNPPPYVPYAEISSSSSSANPAGGGDPVPPQ